MGNYKKISEFGNVTPVSSDLYLIEKADGTYSYVTGTQLLAFFGGGGSSDLSTVLGVGNTTGGQRIESDNGLNFLDLLNAYTKIGFVVGAGNGGYLYVDDSILELYHESNIDLNAPIVNVNGKSILTKQTIQITSSTAPTISTTGCNKTFVDITALAGNINLSTNLTGSPQNGDVLIYQIKDNGTARAITMGSLFEAKGEALPITTVISKRINIGATWDSTTSKWGVIAVAQEV